MFLLLSLFMHKKTVSTSILYENGKNGGETVREALFLLLGMIVGGCVATVLLCCLQLNRINDYEAKIRELKDAERD